MSNKYTTSTHKNVKDEPLYICILVGNVGYREKSAGPRVLKTLGELSIFEHQLNVLRHVFPKATVSVTVGFQADKIIRLRPENSLIIENRLYETENTTEEIRLLLNVINPSRLLLIDGAVMFDEESLRVCTNSTSVFTYKNNDKNEIGVQVEDGLVSRMAYGLEEKWAGLVYLEGLSLTVLKQVCTRERSKLCSHELINLLIDKKIEIKPVSSNKSKLVKF